MVLDTFTFADPPRTLELNPSEVDRLRSPLERVLAGRPSACSSCATVPSPRCPAARRAVAARVSFNSEASATATLIEIVAAGPSRPALRPGLRHFRERRQYRSGTDRHPGPQSHRRLLRDRRRPQARSAKQQAMGEALRKACTGLERRGAARLFFLAASQNTQRVQ